MNTRGQVFDPIPRILHQTWKVREIPAEWRTYRDSWLGHHPSWRYRLWTDADNRGLIERRYPWFLETYDAFDRDIQRVDAAKYFILYTHGGVYADLDCECLKPVDPIVARGGAVVGWTPDRVIECAFLASPAGHPLWEVAFREMQSPPLIAMAVRLVPGLVDASHVLFSTGPRMMKRAVRDYLVRCSRDGDVPGITVCEPRYFSSRSWLRRYEAFPEVETFVRHHYSDSWLQPVESATARLFTARRLFRAAVALILVAAAAAWLLSP